jgi:hypothetical protein
MIKQLGFTALALAVSLSALPAGESLQDAWAIALSVDLSATSGPQAGRGGANERVGAKTLRLPRVTTDLS